MNPKIKKISIGIRHPKEITLYPIAIADEFDMSELITSSLSAIFSAQSAAKDSGEDQSVADAAVKFMITKQIVDTLRENMAKIINIATGGEEKGEALKEIDNEQFINIIETIFEVNFAPLFVRLPEMKKKWGPILGIEEPKQEEPSR